MNCLIRSHTQEQDLTFADTVARSIRTGNGTCSPNGNATRAGNPAGPRSGTSSLTSACVSPLSRSREVTAGLIVSGTAVFCDAQGVCSQVSGGCCRNRYSCTFHLPDASGSCPRTKAARQQVEQIEQTVGVKIPACWPGFPIRIRNFAGTLPASSRHRKSATPFPAMG